MFLTDLFPNIRRYFLGGTAIMIFVTTGVALLTRFIPLSGNIGLFVRLLTCIIVSNTLYYLLFKKFETFCKNSSAYQQNNRKKNI